MSFSSEVKDELLKHSGKSRHCQIAELAALLAFDSKSEVAESGMDIAFSSDNEMLSARYDLLAKKVFHMPDTVADGQRKIYETVKMWDEKHREPVISGEISGMLLQQSCCKRASTKAGLGPREDRPESSRFFRLGPREDQNGSTQRHGVV